MLLAAEALVQVSGLKDLKVDTTYWFLSQFCGNAETRFDRDVGSGDGEFFVWFLTLLVKKKEKRGRRVSAVSRRVPSGIWMVPH